jgi:hypothetical protein
MLEPETKQKSFEISSFLPLRALFLTDYKLSCPEGLKVSVIIKAIMSLSP